MDQQDKFGIRAGLEQPDEPRPKLSRVTTVRELTAALSQHDPEEEIWIRYSPPWTSQSVKGVRRLEISDIFDEHEKRKQCTDPHEREEGGSR